MINNIFATIMILTALVGYVIAHTPKTEVMAQEPVETPVASPSPLPTPETPESYIVSVFGQTNGERAVKMLKECENKKFTNDALNWNGNGTNDFGLFQINSIHGYTHEQLQDYKFNTDIAYKLFTREIVLGHGLVAMWSGMKVLAII